LEGLTLAKKKQTMEGKLRTREHVIADLAVNHTERQALLSSGTVERIERDYGIDLILFTYTPRGEIESGCIFLQVKGTEELSWLKSGRHASFRVLRSDLVGWLREFLPIILIVYGASPDRAYWLHVQGHFAALPEFNLFQAGKSVTVHLPANQVLDPTAIRHFASLRDQAARRTDPK
jgi:hypothetical protein